MIIFADKYFQTRSDIPNDDWTGEALYVVEDGTELAKKIQDACPYYEFVTDEGGELIDILELPRPEPEEPPPSEDPSERITELEDAFNILLEGLS